MFCSNVYIQCGSVSDFFLLKSFYYMAGTLLTRVSDLPSTMNYEEQDLYSDPLCVAQQMLEKGRRGSRKGNLLHSATEKPLHTLLSVRFPIRERQGFSSRGFPWSVPPYCCLGSHVCCRSSAQHKGHRPPRAHTAKGETNQEETRDSESSPRSSSPARRLFCELCIPQVRAHLSHLHRLSAPRLVH